MKKLYCFLFLIASAGLHAQKIPFDLVATYSVITDEHSSARTVYSSSKHPNFFMVITNMTHYKNAKVYDLSTTTVHHYDFKEIRLTEGDYQYEFTYQYSAPARNNHEKFSDFYDFVDIGTYESGKIVHLNVYPNKRKRRIKDTIILKIADHEQNLFPLFTFACLNDVANESAIDYGSGIVQSAQRTFSRNESVSYELTNYDRTELEINIPDSHMLKEPR